MQDKLIKKIHEGMDDTCYAAILTNWDEIEMNEIELAEKAFDIVSKGASEERCSKAIRSRFNSHKKIAERI